MVCRENDITEINFDKGLSDIKINEIDMKFFKLKINNRAKVYSNRKCLIYKELKYQPTYICSDSTLISCVFKPVKKMHLLNQ